MEGCALEVGVEAILVLVFFLEVEVGDGHVDGGRECFGVWLVVVWAMVTTLGGQTQHADQKADVVNWRMRAGDGGQSE